MKIKKSAPNNMEIDKYTYIGEHNHATFPAQTANTTHYASWQQTNGTITQANDMYVEN